MTRRNWWLPFAAGGVLLGGAVFVVHGQQIPSEARTRMQAFLAALSSGSADRFETMAQEHFTPELLASRSPEDRKAMVQRAHDEFGTLTVDGEIVTAPGSVDVQAHGARGPALRLRFTYQPAAPYKLTRVALEAGAEAGQSGPPPLQPPPINPSMSPAVLSDTLDAYLAKLAAAGEFAGVVVVGRDGRPVFQKGYGTADRERGTPITPALRFNIASIGKAFTKTAIGQLVEAGKLSFTDTIGSVLPDYPNAQAKPATVEQLLNHTAGIVDFFGPRFDAAPKAQFKANADYFRFVAGEPLLFAPGTRKQYCNGCYIVLGQIIQKIAAMPYERYIDERIFKPAGMTGAGFLAYGDTNVATGYTRIDGRLVPNDNTQGRHGSAAGGAFARAADLLAFDNALRDHKLLDAKMTAWYLGTEPVTGRAPGTYGIAGGAPGANANLETTGAWTVIVTGNLDPPNASRVAAAIMRQLR